jgi:hypothetical protein
LTRTSLFDFQAKSAFCFCFKVICDASKFVRVILLLAINYIVWNLEEIFLPYLRKPVEEGMEWELEIFCTAENAQMMLEYSL